MIYLIVCTETNTCKIGHSTNPKKRLKQLQTNNPFSLEIRGVILSSKQDTNSLEKVIHNWFKDSRITGEWFHFTEDIKDFFSKFNYYISAVDVNKEKFYRVETIDSEHNVFYTTYNFLGKLPKEEIENKNFEDLIFDKSKFFVKDLPEDWDVKNIIFPEFK